MVLVSYDSDDDDVLSVEEPSRSIDDIDLQRSNSSGQQEKRPPALPAAFQNLYSSNVRSSTIDDPSLHGGRQRQVPHVVGNWPTFVYLEWLPRDQDLAILDKIIVDATSQLHSSADTKPPMTSSLRSDLGVRLPLHISLSAPLILTTDNKDKFEEDIKASISSAAVSAFRIVPARTRWVHNFDRSRHFLVLILHRPEQNELQKLLTACNSTAKQYELPELYAEDPGAGEGVPSNSLSEGTMLPATTSPQDNDKFHISIGWTLQAPPPVQETNIHLPKAFDNFQICFDKVCLKIGNNISTIPLG